jgi:hypothetical protein
VTSTIGVFHDDVGLHKVFSFSLLRAGCHVGTFEMHQIAVGRYAFLLVLVVLHRRARGQAPK